MVRRVRPLLAVLFLASTALAGTNLKQEADLDAARRAYEASDYAKAVQTLQEGAARDPQNGDLHLLLAKNYLELEQLDAAIKSAERAVAIDPQSSVYHEWLGRAHGEKAEHPGPLPAIGWGRKTGRELDAGRRVAAENFSGRQGVIRLGCGAPD